MPGGQRTDADTAPEYPDGFIRLHEVGYGPLPISGLDWDETKSFEHPRSTVILTELSSVISTLLCFELKDSLLRKLTADV